METLIKELKEKIIDALNLEEINSTLPLHLSTIEKNYGIKLANPAEGKAIFQSVKTIAEYVSQHRTK